MASNKDTKNNKNNKKFSKEFKAELKRVAWPTPKQVFNNTIGVVVIVIITAIIVFVLDFIFDYANQLEVSALKNKIESVQSAEDQSASEGETTDETLEPGESSISEEGVSQESTQEESNAAESTISE